MRKRKNTKTTASNNNNNGNIIKTSFQYIFLFLAVFSIFYGKSTMPGSGIGTTTGKIKEQQNKNTTLTTIKSSDNNKQNHNQAQQQQEAASASAVETSVTEKTGSNNNNRKDTMPILFSSSSKSRNALAVAANDNNNNNHHGSFHAIHVFSNAIHTRKPEEKSSYSQAKQDLVVLALMDANDAKIMAASNPQQQLRRGNNDSTQEGKKRRRFFVDLASNDAIFLSNTYLLEKHDWDGLCLEPNPHYWYDLAAYRTCTIVGAFVGGTQQGDGTEIEVDFGTNRKEGAAIGGVLGGIVGKDFDNTPKLGGGESTSLKRDIVSIKTVFEQTNVPQVVDYFSLDVEGAESLVMNQFSWDTYRFKFITIERPKDDLVQMLTSNGYTKAMDLTFWGETLWINSKEVQLTSEEMTDIVNQKGLGCFRCM